MRLSLSCDAGRQLLAAEKIKRAATDTTGAAGTAMRFQPLYVGKESVTDPQKVSTSTTRCRRSPCDANVGLSLPRCADIIPELRRSFRGLRF
jgi:hypothetical protein